MEWIQNVFAVLKTIEIRDIIDILAIAFIIFSLFKLVKETRAAQLLKGVVALLIIYLISSLFGLMMLTSLLRTFFEAAVILVAIIFQPEIRKYLEQMGRNNTYKKYIKLITHREKSDEWKQAVKKSIIDAADTALLFSRSKTGALLVFERETKLSDIAATGTIINADTSVALFGNIFFNKAPLHDGASIVRDGKLFAAGCILPLTDNKNVDINLGTRHRAGLGISEQSDAVVLIVSEETGVISLEKKSQPLYDTLAAALGGILLNAEKKQINVQVDCPENLVVSHDRKWTSEALFNILDNAVKYTPEGGQIRVSVESWEMYVKIDIADTGIGISEQHQGAIFKRFYREDIVHDVDGIGIGLYLAREIVTLQGGYIRVTSEVGRGSTFSVFLPRQ